MDAFEMQLYRQLGRTSWQENIPVTEKYYKNWVEENITE